MSTTAEHASTQTAVLELDDIGKSYGNVHALRGVNISRPPRGGDLRPR